MSRFYVLASGWPASGRRGTAVLVTVLCSMLGDSRAWGQSKQMPNPRILAMTTRGLDRLMVLTASDSIAEELGITEEQMKPLASLAKKVRSEVEGKFRADREAVAAGLEPNPVSLRQFCLKQGELVVVEVDKILNPEQALRLDQIMLQMAGISGLLEDEVAAELELSDEQRDEVQRILNDGDLRVRKLLVGQEHGGHDARLVRKKVGEIQREANDKVLKVLTDEQRQRYEDMLGKRIDPAKIFVPKATVPPQGVDAAPEESSDP